MGLDVYFNRKPFHRHVEKSYTDIVSDLSLSDSSDAKELKTAVEDLYSYSIKNGISFERVLIDLITNHLHIYAEDSISESEEVAYFRKLWWIVNHFKYGDDDYGKDMEITRAQIEDLVSMSRKLILMVEKHFKDNGWEIEHSPLEYDGATSRWGGSRDDYLSFKNGLFTEDMMDEADEICSNALDSSDAFLFYKVCEIYIQFKRILETTDWDSQKIYMSADW